MPMRNKNKLRDKLSICLNKYKVEKDKLHN